MITPGSVYFLQEVDTKMELDVKEIDREKCLKWIKETGRTLRHCASRAFVKGEWEGSRTPDGSRALRKSVLGKSYGPGPCSLIGWQQPRESMAGVSAAAD